MKEKIKRIIEKIKDIFSLHWIGYNNLDKKDKDML